MVKTKTAKKSSTDMDVDEIMGEQMSDASDDGGFDDGLVKSKRPRFNMDDDDKPLMGPKRKRRKILAEKGKESLSAKQHKAVLEGLKDKDPDLYKFLQSEDRGIFNFDDSSDDEPDEHETHTPSGKLLEQESSSSSSDDEEQPCDVDSDDSQEETTPAVSKAIRGNKVLVSVSMVEKWGGQLREKPQQSLFEKLIKAFEAAVEQASGVESATSPYRVEGSQVFNAVVRVCLREIPSALVKFLQIDDKESKITRNKFWSLIKTSLKSYLNQIIELLKNLAGSEPINAVLKHITHMVPYIGAFPKQTRTFIKKLINIWSGGEESSRVLAFISLLKLIRMHSTELLEKTLKAMYMAYIRNCKFTSPTLLPLINFMKHSLVEIFKLNPILGYQYTFVYIRQLAIHLRNAMASKKPDSYQLVYNWQFIHSLAFFSQFVVNMKNDENIKQLIYPLIQIIIGTIRLIPTQRYYPLRFHCVRMLNLISRNTALYIPTATLLLEIFDITNFHKKIKKLNTKSLDMSTVLKLNKGQMDDRAFKDSVMDQFYELFFDHIISYHNTVSFPEMILPTLHQLKSFVKTVKITNFTKQVQQIISKIETTIVFIEKKRTSISLNLADELAVADFEMTLDREGTPLKNYYRQYRLLRDRELQYQLGGKEQMETYDNTPLIPTGQRKATTLEREQFFELFADEEGEQEREDDSERFKLKSEREKKIDKNSKSSKNKKSKESDPLLDDDDDVSSLASEDYDLLNRSASDDGDDDDEDIEMDDEDDDSEMEVDSADSADSGEDSAEDEEVINSKQDVVKDFSLDDF